MLNSIELVYESYQALLEINPYHAIFELFMAIVILYVVFKKPYQIQTEKLSKKEEEDLLKEWKPQPLIPQISPLEKLNSIIPFTVSKVERGYVVIDDKSCANFGSSDFLGFVGNEVIENAAVKALKKYGCGSCGPRGFYGSIDVHIELEEKITSFLQTEGTILYSSSFACTSSCIPAFSKRGDIIVADSMCNFALQTGNILSRSHVRYFDHNNMQDLEKILQEITNKKGKLQRRFLVVEGLYTNDGSLCPLPEIVRLKNKYKFRLIMDESNSIGSLGNTGRGITEHFSLPITDVDILIGSCEKAFGIVGGFSSGTKRIVGHQRLGSLGYVFSASAPPFSSVCGIEAINEIESKPELLEDLHKKTEIFRNLLKNNVEGLTVIGDQVSPIIHLVLSNPSDDRIQNETILQTICDKILETNSIVLVRSKYSQGEFKMPQPSIRVCSTVVFDEEIIENFVKALQETVSSVLN